MNLEQLKELIISEIYENNNEEISGQNLQDCLLAICDKLSDGLYFGGYIEPSNLIIPATNNLYLPKIDGYYPSFDVVVEESNNVQYMCYDSSLEKWKVEEFDIQKSGELYQNITYQDLKFLRDQNLLILGKKYKIVDYNCILPQEEYLTYRSAGHRFDIIVEAIASNKLSEDAKAAIHEGDTYFQNSALDRWQVKYCLDNDTTRFAWATPEGKGVIYFLRDEFYNECWYDFKNILFQRYKITGLTEHASSVTISNTYHTTDTSVIFDSVENPFALLAPGSGSNSFTFEQVSEFYYTFNGIEQTFTYEDGTRVSASNVNYDMSLCNKSISQEFVAQFGLELTFGYDTPTGLIDSVRCNKIGPLFDVIFENASSEVFSCKRLKLSGNVFFGVHYEDFENGSWKIASVFENTLASGCFANTFVSEYFEDCSKNNLGEECNYNIIYKSYENTLDYKNEYWVLSYSRINTFGKVVSACSLTNCHQVIFSGQNTFISMIHSYCCRFGINTHNFNCSTCSEVTLGDGVNSYTYSPSSKVELGSYCSGIVIDNNCRDITIGKDSKNLLINPNCSKLTISQSCVNITFFCGVYNCVLPLRQGYDVLKNIAIFAGNYGGATLNLEFNKLYTQFVGCDSNNTIQVKNLMD